MKDGANRQSSYTGPRVMIDWCGAAGLCVHWLSAANDDNTYTIK